MRISDWSSGVCSSDPGIAVIKEGMEKGVIKPDYQTYVALGQAYYFTDQPAQAIENYRKADPLAPDGETYLNLARILWGEGQLGEAKQAAPKALDKGVQKAEEDRTIERKRVGKGKRWSERV